MALNLRSPDPQYEAVWGYAQYEVVSELCTFLIDELGYDIICIPMVRACVQGSGDDPGDDQLLMELAEHIDRPGHVSVLEGDCRPAEVAAVLSRAHLAIGMRLHFLILAANSRTPVVALSYAPKVSAFMESIGLDMCCLDFASADFESLRSRVIHLLENRNGVVERISAWHSDSLTSLKTIRSLITATASSRGILQRFRSILALPLLRLLFFMAFVYSKKNLPRWPTVQQKADADCAADAT